VTREKNHYRLTDQQPPARPAAPPTLDPQPGGRLGKMNSQKKSRYLFPPTTPPRKNRQEITLIVRLVESERGHSQVTQGYIDTGEGQTEIRFLENAFPKKKRKKERPAENLSSSKINEKKEKKRGSNFEVIPRGQKRGYGVAISNSPETSRRQPTALETEGKSRGKGEKSRGEAWSP